MTSTEKTSTKPVQVFKLRGISASVFRNATDNGPFYKVQVVRTYKDGDEFKTTPSYTRDDLPIVSVVAQKAWEYVLDQEADERSKSDEK